MCWTPPRCGREGMAIQDGRDSAGREVSSGVCIYRLEGLGAPPAAG